MPSRKPHHKRSIEKIKNGMVLERLMKHFDGGIELSQTQVNVGLSLIKKYIPDLKAIEHSGTTKHEVDVNAKSAKHIANAIREEITRDG